MLTTMNTPGKLFKALLLVVLGLVMVGCGNLREQPKLDEPYQESPVFGRAAREILPEAVPVGFERADTHLYEGMVEGEFVETFPFEITEEVLAVGERGFNDYCAICHGYAGYGNGVVGEEGYPRPASYHTDDLLNAPVGRLYQAITYGVGNMFSYAARLPDVEERWAIVAYIRALQYSQNVPLDELPDDLQAQFQTAQEGTF